MISQEDRRMSIKLKDGKLVIKKSDTPGLKGFLVCFVSKDTKKEHQIAKVEMPERDGVPASSDVIVVKTWKDPAESREQNRTIISFDIFETERERVQKILDKVEEYMEIPYNEIYEKVEGRRKFIGHIPDFEGCIAQARSIHDLRREMRKAKREWIRKALDEGREIPEATEFKKSTPKKKRERRN